MIKQVRILILNFLFFKRFKMDQSNSTQNPIIPSFK